MSAGQRERRGIVIECSRNPRQGRVAEGAIVIITSRDVVGILGREIIGLVTAIAIRADFAVIKG